MVPLVSSEFMRADRLRAALSRDRPWSSGGRKRPTSKRRPQWSQPSQRRTWRAKLRAGSPSSASSAASRRRPARPMPAMSRPFSLSSPSIWAASRSSRTSPSCRRPTCAPGSPTAAATASRPGPSCARSRRRVRSRVSSSAKARERWPRSPPCGRRACRARCPSPSPSAPPRPFPIPLCDRASGASNGCSRAMPPCFRCSTARACAFPKRSA